MKLVYEDGEIAKIRDMVHKSKDAFGTTLNVFEKGHKYSMDFIIDDPDIAFYVLTGMLFNHVSQDDVNLGIKVVSINSSSMTDIDKAKAKLHKAIDDLLP